MATAQHTTEPTESEQTPDLEKRTRRALEEYITILPNAGNGDGETIVTAVSESGSSYTVDVREGRCGCPDSEHRNPDGGCKHLRRARFALGLRRVPEAPHVDIDPRLGEHTDTEVKRA